METLPKYHILSCSGASNTGKYSDEVARILMGSGEAKMQCLARFVIDNQFAINSKNDIKKLVVLDGRPINCAEKLMKMNGLENFQHINTTDFDIVKGNTPFSAEKANEIIEHIKKIMQ